jgi:hypothetical protein
MTKNKLFKKIEELENQLTLSSYTSNLNRARSINVGTAFGGTSEIMIRGEGDKFLYAVLQPVEVVELIHQLCANVCCSAELKPRNDFASWRDWRTSEAEKNHLNGHAPFVTDMAVFQKLGASGYNDEEAKKIMDLLANTKEFANEHDASVIRGKEKDIDGAPAIMIGEEDGLIHNKLILDENQNVVYMAGGEGGNSQVRRGDDSHLNAKFKKQTKAKQK